MQLVNPPTGTFTTQELERLAAYRAAVKAGFYTDWDGSARSPDMDVLAWLSRADGAVDGDAYPFTTDERHSLERLKAAVADDSAGRYTADRPPAVTITNQDDAKR
jgi:hypothetical protein